MRRRRGAGRAWPSAVARGALSPTGEPPAPRHCAPGCPRLGRGAPRFPCRPLAVAPADFSHRREGRPAAALRGRRAADARPLACACSPWPGPGSLAARASVAKRRPALERRAAGAGSGTRARYLVAARRLRFQTGGRPHGRGALRSPARRGADGSRRGRERARPERHTKFTRGGAPVPAQKPAVAARLRCGAKPGPRGAEAAGGRLGSLRRRCPVPAAPVRPLRKGEKLPARF